MISTLSSPVQTRTLHRPSRLVDRGFFWGMSLLILVIVWFGFARSYYLAGVTAAPLPNRLIHVHAMAFTLWIFFFIVQVGLVSAGNIKLHRWLGIGGFVLAVAMVFLGLAAGIDSMHRGVSVRGIPPRTFFINQFTPMVLFATFIFFGFRARRQPEVHKRLMLLSTISLTSSPVAHWPFAIVHRVQYANDLIGVTMLLLIVAFDLVTQRRVMKVTMLGSAFWMVIHAVRIPLATSAPWDQFAGWVERTF